MIWAAVVLLEPQHILQCSAVPGLGPEAVSVVLQAALANTDLPAVKVLQESEVRGDQ